MPTYDFRCTTCDHEFEVNRPMGATDPVTCPKCDDPAKKVFSPVGVAFKGSGFHNTDYKSKPSTTSEAPASCAGGSSDSCAGCPSASTS